MNCKNYVDSFLKEVGIKPAKTYAHAVEMAAKAGSPDIALRLRKMISSRGKTGVARDDSALYNLKNSNYEVAMAFTGAIDYHIIEGACIWVMEHKDLFHDDILEIGFDTGIISCFLGRLFPDKKITSIDRYEKSVKVAEKLADKMKVTNVSFIRSDAKKMEGKYSTVFSCRTMHENGLPENYSSIDVLEKSGREYERTLSPYAHILTGLVADGGNLISIERQEMDPRYLGWMWALNECGFVMSQNTYREIAVHEADDFSEFQAAEYTLNPLINADSVFEQFAKITFKKAKIPNIKGNWGSAKCWAALTAVHVCADELIDGYIVYSNEFKTGCMRCAVYKNKYDDDSILTLFQYNDIEQTVVYNSYMQFLSGNIEEMHKYLRNAADSQSVTIYKLVREDGVESKGKIVKEI